MYDINCGITPHTVASIYCKVRGRNLLHKSFYVNFFIGITVNKYK